MHYKHLLVEILLTLFLLIPTVAEASHPLATDDTGTQGKGNFLWELNGQYDSDKEEANGITASDTGGEVSAALTYGILENIDLVLTLPYQWGKTEKNETATYNERGFSDTSLEVKWRFWEKDGFSLAVKPGINFPTGDEKKGLGAGKLGGHLFLIGTKELGAWAFHANLGYIRNENDSAEQSNLWHASAAATWEIVKNWKLTFDLGIERNRDDNAKDDPAFIIGGVIYSLTDKIDLDCGAQYGLTSSEKDWSLMAGIAVRF